MAGLKIADKSKLLDTIENLVKFKSAIIKEYEPWHKALVLLREKKVDEAAALVSETCNKNFLGDPIKRLIVDEISNQAVIENIEGPGIESLCSTVADYGYLDLAYNAGNQILWRKRNKTVDDYKLASRYFQMAISGSSSDSIKYSAQTNYAEIVREGLVTGEKDWLGAIALYEEAGNKGLVNAMFNAGNVLLWLVEAGDKTYSIRAQVWFERIIDHVESGKECIDLGGRGEAIARLKSAKIRLAGMHIDKLLESYSLTKAQSLISEYVDDERVRGMLERISSEMLMLNNNATLK